MELLTLETLLVIVALLGCLYLFILSLVKSYFQYRFSYKLALIQTKMHLAKKGNEDGTKEDNERS